MGVVRAWDLITLGDIANLVSALEIFSPPLAVGVADDW